MPANAMPENPDGLAEAAPERNWAAQTCFQSNFKLGAASATLRTARAGPLVNWFLILIFFCASFVVIRKINRWARSL